jgi:hypothetical protein
MAREFDLFLSYRSTDAEVVRLICEQLIASGSNPWFAEYLIQLANRPQFFDAIVSGIQSSKAGLAFTHDDYLTQHTHDEMSRLQAKLGAGQIREVRMPRHPQLYTHFPAQESCRSIELPRRLIPGNTSYINQVLQFITNEFALPAARVPTLPPAKTNYFHDSKIGYRLNLSGWKITTKLLRWLWLGKYRPLFFQRTINNHRIHCNLMIGPAGSVRQPAPSFMDDREYYELIGEFASEQFFTGSRRCVGVHLTRVGNHSQFGVTYKFDKSGIWFRRYAIDLLHSSGETLEFAFVFSTTSTFREFCRYAYLCDQVVKSLQMDA